MICSQAPNRPQNHREPGWKGVALLEVFLTKFCPSRWLMVIYLELGSVDHIFVLKKDKCWVHAQKQVQLLQSAEKKTGPFFFLIGILVSRIHIEISIYIYIYTYIHIYIYTYIHIFIPNWGFPAAKNAPGHLWCFFLRSMAAANRIFIPSCWLVESSAAEGKTSEI